MSWISKCLTDCAFISFPCHLIPNWMSCGTDYPETARYCRSAKRSWISIEIQIHSLESSFSQFIINMNVLIRIMEYIPCPSSQRNNVHCTATAAEHILQNSYISFYYAYHTILLMYVSIYRTNQTIVCDNNELALSSALNHHPLECQTHLCSTTHPLSCNFKGVIYSESLNLYEMMCTYSATDLIYLLVIPICEFIGSVRDSEYSIIHSFHAYNLIWYMYILGLSKEYNPDVDPLFRGRCSSEQMQHHQLCSRGLCVC